MRKNEQPDNLRVLIFVEGDTDELLFKKLMEYYADTSDRQLCPFEICNLKGVTRYTSKLLAKLKNEYLPQARKSGYKIKAVCCSYDTDVFEVEQPSMIDWMAIKKKVGRMGIKEFLQIGVRSSIEDWILDDIEGVCRYLKLKEIPHQLKGKNGYAKLVNLYGKAHRMYQKGYKTEGLISSLDMCVIRNRRKSVLKSLEEALLFVE